ncbi:4-(cytidine 5'-diphospho)-2-C-methyl-D-erythritol kinase [Bacteroidota bacterium]
MIILSPAKINIGLQILKKRDDGFHDISTLMYLISLADIIEIKSETQNAGFSFSQTGIKIPGELEANLCYKAWQLFSDEVGQVSAKVHLHKIIPMGAGLGGGSSNAAAILKGLNVLHDRPLYNSKLYNLASQLGSDCSLFIKEESSMALGRGEILRASPVDLSGFHLVLLNPGIEVNTAWAYSHVTPDQTRISLDELLSQPMEEWNKIIKNDFEESVFRIHPEIAQLKSELYSSGAIYASMSGSGSSVFGIFKKAPILSANSRKYQIFAGTL